MNMNPDRKRALWGTYHQMLPIVTRKVIQIQIELPMEKMVEFVTLFGSPNPGTRIGLARMDDDNMIESEDHGKEVVPIRQASPQASVARPVRDWTQLSPAQQAGIMCGEPPFWKFLKEEHNYDVNSQNDAAEAVRDFCGVTSRRDIAAEHRTRMIWHSLVEAYRLWQRAPECVA